jgi:hypothetical protein
MILTGGDGYTVEFSTPDCQDGWSVIKNGTGQSIGCYKTKEEAEQAMEGLDGGKTDILADEVRTAKSPEEVQEDMKKSVDSFWGGVFVPSDKGQMGPDFNSQDQDARYYFPSQSPRDTDGEPKIGYGNSATNGKRNL